MRERIRWLDIAKGIGIICVLFGHSVFKNELWRIWLYSFHMPLFFFLSGVTYNEQKYPNLNTLLSSKVRAIIVPYLILCMIALGRNGIAQLSDYLMLKQPINFAIITKKIIGIFVAVRGSSFYCAAWFLPCIFCVYFLLQLLIRISDNIPFHHTKITVASLSALLALVGLLYARLSLPYLPWALDAAFVAVFFMALGWLSKDIIPRIIHPSFALVCAGGGSLLSYMNFRVSGVSIDMYSGRYCNECLFILAALCGIMFVIVLSQAITDNFGVFTHIGKNSLYYYGVNVLMLDVVEFVSFGVLQHVASDNSAVTLLKCTIKVAIALGVSRLFLPLFNRAQGCLNTMFFRKLGVINGKK